MIANTLPPFCSPPPPTRPPNRHLPSSSHRPAPSPRLPLRTHPLCPFYCAAIRFPLPLAPRGRLFPPFRPRALCCCIISPTSLFLLLALHSPRRRSLGLFSVMGQLFVYMANGCFQVPPVGTASSSPAHRDRARDRIAISAICNLARTARRGGVRSELFQDRQTSEWDEAREFSRRDPPLGFSLSSRQSAAEETVFAVHFACANRNTSRARDCRRGGDGTGRWETRHGR